MTEGCIILSSPRLRKGLLALSVAANLSLLCYFKYANFFLRSLEDALAAAGLSASLPVLRVLVMLERNVDARMAKKRKVIQ